ncbi:MAG: hypothetical protein U0521_00245 [Anaerolineae bacterium]
MDRPRLTGTPLMVMVSPTRTVVALALISTCGGGRTAQASAWVSPVKDHPDERAGQQHHETGRWHASAPPPD